MTDYHIRVRFKSNEAPFATTHTPAAWHQPADDEAAVRWAESMAEGLGTQYDVALYDGDRPLRLPTYEEMMLREHGMPWDQP